MKKKLFCVFVFGFLIFASCEKKRSFHPGTVNFQVSYNENFDEVVYPSVILGLANYTGNNESVQDDFFTFKLKSPVDRAILKIKVDETPLNFETVFQAELKERGKEYSFSPIIKWKYDKLKSLEQAATVDFTFTCYINDEEVSIENVRLNCRGINECVLGLIDTNNHYVDFKWMLASYVNEDHYMIDVLLKDILEQKIVKRFVGYQGSEKDVENQIFAIWYFMQNRGVRYSSIAAISRPSPRVFSQYVRFFDQVYNNRQANCIDGCIFFSSVLKRIGMSPFLVGEPQHMYMGVYKNPDKKEVLLLETTYIGEVDLSEIQDKNTDSTSLDKYKHYLNPGTFEKYMNDEISLDDVKKEISYKTFQKAITSDIKKYNATRKKMMDPNNREYHFYDISELRKVIQPIGR